jgi:hypothetical protein
MDANLNFLSTPAVNPVSSGEISSPLTAKSMGDKAMLGKEFANIMRSLLPESERQHLAAAQPFADLPGLKTLQLGPQFDLITGTGAQPNEDSLAAFAKSQGLDDSAVQALFGGLQPLSTKSLQMSGATSPKSGLQVMDPAHPAILVEAPKSPSSDPNQVPGWFLNATAHPVLQDISSPVSPAIQVGPMVANPLPGLQPASALGLPFASPTQLAAPSDATPPVADAQALSQLLASHGAQAVLKTQGLGVTPRDATALESLAQSSLEDAPGHALRMRLMPAWEDVTRQLASANGSGQAMTWANLISGWSGKAQKTGSADAVIDLGDTSIGASTDTGDGLGTVSATFNNDNNAQLVRGPDQAPSLNLSGKPTGPGVTDPSIDRAAQVSQLADKLGQALSERLQHQIEQGQWKLELRLKPAHLGKISVELDMNAGGLDALFKTDNLMTRDLIAQGTQRLRDNLAQAGMTVANVWVNSQSQPNSGGNSTPRRPSEVVASGSVEPTPAVEEKKPINIAKSSDGWDQLV